jgi:type I restriction enzyme S subunit
MIKYENYSRCPQIFNEVLPSHWTITPMYGLAKEKKISDCADLELLSVYLDLGVIPFSQKAEKRTNVTSTDLSKYQRVDPGDFVLNNQQAWRGSVGVSRYTGIVSPAYIVLEMDDRNNSEFMNYMLRSHTMVDQYVINSKSVGSIQRNIHWISLKRTYVPVPPRVEQDQIVRFLDWKVSEINKLIGIRRKEIQELRSFKNAVVSQLVTRGMDSHAEMKYSGVNWLGDIPKRWKVVKLRQILHSVSEKNHPELPLLSVVREKGVIIRDVDDTESNHNYIPDDLSNYKVVRKNQFAMNKMKAWQGSYGVSPYTGIVSPAYFIFDIDFKNLEYFHYAIRSKVYVNFFAQASDGIRVGQWDLQMDKMKEIPFIVPSEQEQEEIVETIKTLQKKCESRMDDLHKEIDVLVELKNKIISDVVTGKIDVRNVTVPEYEHVDDIAEDDSEDVKEETDGEEE